MLEPYTTKAEATAAARTAKKELGRYLLASGTIPQILRNLKDWRIVVWENLGWHFKISNRNITLRCDRSMWRVGLSREIGGVGTEAQFSVRASFRSPRAAIIAQLDRLRQQIQLDLDLLESVTDSREVE